MRREFDAIKKDERDIALEFEVWARIIKDSEGRDVQAFIKEDKKHGLRKDSSFYHSGYWEVFEFDDAARETRFRTSSGIRSLRKHDDKKRLKEYYRTDKGDTLESQRYEWKNGRLVRMTANGIVRNYIYGKTLNDTVRVVPSDEGFNYHRGYNGTAGKIPEEGAPDYETFSLNPYGHVAFGEKEEDEELPNAYFVAKTSFGSLNVLGKVPTQGCISKENYVNNMPEPWCIRFQKEDIPKNLTREEAESFLKYGYPGSRIGPSYGISYRKLSLNLKCECNDAGKYRSYFAASTYNHSIEVYLNIIRYDSSKELWQDCYWHRDDLLKTYIHETKHVKNSIEAAKNLTKSSLIITFNAREKCEKYIDEEKNILEYKWEEWLEAERSHDNPNSPKYSGRKVPDVCK
ncbi:MAG: hypothetical protein LBH25_05605 [Fibromonadaceae bacterium]|nr:hypothetical protein [Fibromonadaceae bacterium]